MKCVAFHDMNKSNMHLLLLHGLAGAPENWCATLSHLPQARALTPRIDYLNMCSQGLPGLASSMLRSLPPWFDPRQAVVAGNSLGAAVALLAGASFARIVLVAPHMHIAHGRLDRGASTVQRELSRIFHAPDRLHSLQIREYEQLWQRASATRSRLTRLRKLKRRVLAFNLEHHLARFASKTLLVSGRSDLLTPVPLARSLQWKHPEMELHILESCGHAVPLEQPQTLARLLSRAWASSQRTPGTQHISPKGASRLATTPSMMEA